MSYLAKQRAFTLDGETAMSKLQVLAEPLLVGREKELEELQSFLNSAIKGRGKTVFVSGEAGAGKTRLVTEFLDRAKKQGITTLTGWCLSNAAVPYFPFFEAFSHYFMREQPAEQEVSVSGADGLLSDAVKPTRAGAHEIDLAAWLMGPVQAGKAQAISPQVWKDQTFAAVATTLSSIASTCPVVLLVDDIHWADSASLALIHYIARAVSTEKIFLIATYRSEALVADAEGRPHPLVETLQLMRREDLFKEIKLASLNQKDVSSLASNMLGGDLQLGFADKLSRESQGNPLFLVESLRMLHERDCLTLDRDRWRLTSDELGMPDKIRDIILQRLSRLTRSERKLLDAASVVGERFEPQLVASALGLELAEVAEALDSIGKTTALVCCEGMLYRFDHARSRDAVYSEISPTLRKVYHSKVAENLETAKKSGDLLSTDLAYHFAMAGNKDKALKYALAAGQDSLARWSNEEAIKHFTYILQNTSEMPEDAEIRRKAEEGLGDAYLANSMFKDAIRTFEDLNNRQTGADKLRSLRKAMEATFMHRDIKHLMELVKEAEPLAAADRLEYARVLVFRGRAHTFGSYNPKLGLADNVAAFRVFDEEYSLWDAALALLGCGNESLLGESGRVHEGLAAMLRSIALFKELGDVRFQMEAIFGIGLVFRNCGLFDEALKLLDEAAEINEKTRMGDYARLFQSTALSISMVWYKHDSEEALSRSLKALELLKQTDSLEAPAVTYSYLCMTYAIVGDMTHAEEYFEKFMKQPPEIRNSIMVHGSVVEAVFFAGKNQWKESNQRFKEMIKATKTIGLELSLKILFAWALEKQGRTAEAHMLREEVQKSIREIQEKVTPVWLQASLMVRREVRVGEELEMHIDIVNVSRTLCQLIKVETIVPPDGFKISSLPVDFSLQEGGFEMKGRNIGAFQVATGKVTLKAIKTGTFALSLKATYKDEVRETKTCKVDPITVTVQPSKPTFEVLPSRVATGTLELDRLLYGGVPEGYAVALVSPSFEERQKLIEHYVEAGFENGQTTFYLTSDPGRAKSWAEEKPSTIFLFVCNPKADLMVKDLPNIYKLKGIDNLTEIDIASAKAIRKIDPSNTQPKRACIEIVSDVLLQHHPVTTRKWLSGLIQELKSKDFTILAVTDPTMHPQEELQAVLGLFDGEIHISEKEGAKGMLKTLQILKLHNQNYLKEELAL